MADSSRKTRPRKLRSAAAPRVETSPAVVPTAPALRDQNRAKARELAAHVRAAPPTRHGSVVNDTLQMLAQEGEILGAELEQERATAAAYLFDRAAHLQGSRQARYALEEAGAAIAEGEHEAARRRGELDDLLPDLPRLVRGTQRGGP